MKSRSIWGTSFCSVSLWSIFIAIFCLRSSRRKEAHFNSKAEEIRVSLRRLLQSPQMKPAVHIDDFAGAEREQVPRNGGDRPADILRRAPALDGRQPFGDEFVVFVFHRAGHVGGDNAGT